MAEVAAPGSLRSDSVHLRGVGLKVGPALKRKTPSELRGEQLKKRTSIEIVDNSPSALQKSTLVDCMMNKSNPVKNTKYVEMRLNEVYPVKKPSSRFRLLSGKTAAKESVLPEGNTGIKSCSVSSNLALMANQESFCQNASAASAENRTEQQFPVTEKCSQNRFRSVAELSLGSDRFAEFGTIDVDKALKGLVSHDPSSDRSSADSSGRFSDLKPTSSGKISSEFNVLGGKIPVDFTLKTSLRILSSSPNIWFHRLLMAGTYTGMPQLSSQQSSFSAHSWAYPQSSLPPRVISALSSVTGEVDFLTKRQLAWEDSFRNLYYMLRKNICDIFYVYTSNFVVMFTATGGAVISKRKCNAYISQSTRGLRSLLSEHDVSFSMPLCSSEEEQISRDDLVELSEIEKHNLGQAKRFISMSDVDNTPQSLLSFNGNESVHCLYDFLLNYKSLLTSLTGMDVPVLYSPVPFQNASLETPELRCKEIKTADHYVARLQDFARNDGVCNLDSPGGISYCIEVKDAYLPPWIISSICGAMVSAGSNFEASFTTDPNSAGLNVVLQVIDKTCDDPQDHADNKHPGSSSSVLGIPATVIAPELHFASFKGLKYGNGSCTASIYAI